MPDPVVVEDKISAAERLAELTRPIVAKICGEEVAKIVEAKMATAATSYGATLGLGAPEAVERGGNEAAGRAGAQSRPKSTRSGLLGRVMRNLKLAGGDAGRGAERAKKLWGAEDPVTKIFEASAQSDIQKSLVSDDLSAGGVMVVGDYAMEFIDLLVPRVAVRALRPQSVPMPSGSLTIPKTTADTVAQWVGETQAPAPSQPKTGANRMDAKKLSTIVPFSNDLSRRTDGRVDSYIERLAVRRMGLTEDLGFLRGPGTKFSPRGLKSWAKTTVPANGTVNFTNTLADLGKMIETLEGANVQMISPGIIFSTRTKNYLMFQALNSFGVPFFLEMMSAGNLLGYPFAATNQVPNNLDSNSSGTANQSEIYLADFDQVMIGDTLALQVAMSQEASYDDGTGNQLSSFGRDESVMRLIEEVDLGVEHEEAVTLLTSVLWGA